MTAEKVVICEKNLASPAIGRCDEKFTFDLGFTHN